ncbi:secologanin synthase [Phtheirospermum japonicum]|uniref:Secologanin synthase n=1 Tax=Phtheirospermum japonicum TaxID=374723 RepID=A0A830BQF0_9LAMI|nr:secologanin synthase [Phtheirospermum japonicum]
MAILELGLVPPKENGKDSQEARLERQLLQVFVRRCPGNSQHVRGIVFQTYRNC